MSESHRLLTNKTVHLLYMCMLDNNNKKGFQKFQQHGVWDGSNIYTYIYIYTRIFGRASRGLDSFHAMFPGMHCSVNRLNATNTLRNLIQACEANTQYCLRVSVQESLIRQLVSQRATSQTKYNVWDLDLVIQNVRWRPGHGIWWCLGTWAFWYLPARMIFPVCAQV